MARVAGPVGGMRIHVTPGTRLIGEMILARLWRRNSRDTRRIGIVCVRQGFVTVAAEDGRMSVRQNELRLGVARKVERRGPERFLRMAEVTSIIVWCCLEFTAVGVGVALGTD